MDDKVVALRLEMKEGYLRTPVFLLEIPSALASAIMTVMKL